MTSVKLKLLNFLSTHKFEKKKRKKKEKNLEEV